MRVACDVKDFNWEFDFDPDYPAHFFRYCVRGHQDCMHWHRYFEIGLCVDGSGSFYYYTKQYPVQTDDLFRSNNYESHVALNSANDETHYIFLILLPDFISSCSSVTLNHPYIDAFLYNSQNFTNRIEAGSDTAGQIAPLMHRGLAVYL